MLPLLIIIKLCYDMGKDDKEIVSPFYICRWMIKVDDKLLVTENMTISCLLYRRSLVI